jgi:hypothetical protein
MSTPSIWDRVSRPGGSGAFPTQKGNSMSIKLKILGLGVLAVMATSAFAAVNASALSNGHFTAEPTEHHLILKGTEATPGNHNLSFYRLNSDGTTASGSPIKCTHAAYEGTLPLEGKPGTEATTTQAVQVRPTYKECSTGAEPPHNIPIDISTGCKNNVFEFKSGGTGTVNVNCDITITHPSCHISILASENKNLSGVTYTTTTESNKHALTMNVNVNGIKGTFVSGICVFLGTKHTFEMIGSVTVWGENTAGGRVGITHT